MEVDTRQARMRRENGDHVGNEGSIDEGRERPQQKSANEFSLGRVGEFEGL